MRCNSVKRLLITLVLVAGMHAATAHADDSSDMRVTQEAMRDAKAFQIAASHANRYHKAYKVTIEIAEAFLNQASYQEIIARSYPILVDQEIYRNSFMAWIAWDTEGKFAK
jgi:hypothetical protein